MFESSMAVSDLISLAKDSADIAPDIDEEYFLLWLNSLEGRLYTGVIRETASALCTVYREEPAGGHPYVMLSEVAAPQGQSRPRFCDIETILAADNQLTKTDAGAAAVFADKGAFYSDAGKVRLARAQGLPDQVRVLYRARPAAKTGQTGEKVSLPDEFLPMALAFLTGNAYALAGEDGQAAKWLDRYNADLNDFVEWLTVSDKKFAGVMK